MFISFFSQFKTRLQTKVTKLHRNVFNIQMTKLILMIVEQLTEGFPKTSAAKK